MLERGNYAPAASRWGQLADRRAAELLASSHSSRTLVVESAGGFPYRRFHRPGTTVLSVRGGRHRCNVRGVPSEIPFSSETFTSVIDTTRPEQPMDHESLLRELLRVCRPGGTVASIACGGTPTSSAGPGPRSLTRLEEFFRGAGSEIERTVPFDVLAPLSPWRLMLGERRAQVLGELEEHLRFPRVRRAVRLLERHLVAAFPPSQGGRVFVLARRPQVGQVAGAVGSDQSRPSIRSIIDADEFGTAVLRFFQDDPVVCWAAFLDAEILSDLRFDLASYLVEMGSRPDNAATAARTFRRKRRWRYSGLEMQLLLCAVTYRMTKRTISALRDAPESTRDGVFLPETLEYEVFSALSRELERSLAAVQ